MLTLRLAIAIGMLQVLTACPGEQRSSKATGPRQVIAGSSNEGILKLILKINAASTSAYLSIQNIPDEATLTCAIDKNTFDPCRDGVDVILPQEDGEHALTVIARVKDKVQAVGETHFEIGQISRKKRKNALVPGSISRTFNSDLTIEPEPSLIIQGQPFQDGMAIKRTEDVTFEFHFTNTPLCDPVVRCTTDREGSKFSPLCDLPMGKSYLAHTMPKGLQFLKIQATCGDKAGEPLTIFWYGVDSDYSYMALDTTYLAKRDRYVFNLMNPSDCPENLLRFECRSTSGGNFSECTGIDGAKNVVSNPPVGFAMRAVCNGTPYQAYEALQN